MNGVPVTIGLPVYNGADLLAESLDAILAQNFEHFRVLVFDNASTDETPDIVAGYAARDSRVVHHRQPTNVGAGQNFLDVLAAADSPYFLWRADDDLASPDYLETLVAKLEANPNAALAVPLISSQKPGKSAKTTRYVSPWPPPRIITILRRMFLASPAWIYGVWRTEKLRSYYLPCWEMFPHAWANDHLVILQAILDEALVGDNQPVFYQRIDMRQQGRSASRRPLDEIIAEKTEYMHRFRQACRTSVDSRRWGTLEGAIIRYLVTKYADKRVNVSPGKLWRLKMRRRLSKSR